MTGRAEIEHVLDSYLAEGPETVADQAVMRTLNAIDRTKQRRDLVAPWRTSFMALNSRLAAAMLVAIVAVGGAAYLLGQRAGVGSQQPTPVATPTSPAPTASAVAVLPARTPSPTVDPSTWIPFTSAVYGFSAAHPINWSEGRASGSHAAKPGGEANPDIFWSPSGWPDFNGFELQIPAGQTTESFLQGFLADAIQHTCYPPTPNLLTQTTVGGHAATIAYAGCNEHFYFAQATVVIGKRIWFFDLHGPDRSLIVPFLTTIKIDPTKVVD